MSFITWDILQIQQWYIESIQNIEQKQVFLQYYMYLNEITCYYSLREIASSVYLIILKRLNWEEMMLWYKSLAGIPSHSNVRFLVREVDKRTTYYPFCLSEPSFTIISLS